MPTTLTSFADSEIHMRYREPFLTEGLDLKLAVNTPPGVYRGFRLTTSGTALSVTVAASDSGDHSAVVQTNTGHSLTIRKTGGNFTLNLSAFVNKWVVLAIYATYALGSETTAEIRVYEYFPVDTFSGAIEKPELVVLGLVAVPAAGVIADSSITPIFRTSAWMATAREATPWLPVIKNGGFEWAHDAQTYKYAIADWELSTTAGGNWRASSSLGARTGGRALQLNVTASPVTCRARQFLGVPVPAGRWVRVEAWVRSLIVPTGSPNVDIELNFTDEIFSAATSFNLPLVIIGGTDGTWRRVEAVFVAEPGMAFLESVDIRASGQTYGSTGVALLVDDVQVYVERVDALDVHPPDFHGGHGRWSSMAFEDPSAGSILTEIAALLRFDYATPSNEGTFTIERKDQDYSGGKLPPAFAHLGRLISLGSRLLGTAADARKARISTPFHNTFDATLIWESTPVAGSIPSVRLYVSLAGLVLLTINASYDGTNWNKDFAGSLSTLWQVRRGVVEVYYREADAAWTTWTQINRMAGPAITSLSNPDFEPLLAHFDAGGNRRVTVDHLGFPSSHISELREEWFDLSSSSIPNGTTLRFWSFFVSGTGNQYRDKIQDGTVYQMGVRGLFQSIGNGAGVATAQSVQLFIGSGGTGNTMPFDDQIQVWSWDVCAYGFVGANPGGTLEHGLRGNNSRATFVKLDGNANWQLRTQIQAGTNTTVDTGVPVSTGPQRLRLEVYGTNTPGGRRVLAYIDGLLVAESSTNLPDAFSVMDWRFEAVRTTATSTKICAIGPLLGRWTRFLSDHPL